MVIHLVIIVFILNFTFFIIFSAFSSTFAQIITEDIPLFLNISPGARAGGIGEAYVSIADDASATFWNPAGLSFQNQIR